MKLHTNDTPVEVHGGSEASNFSIEMNAKAFRVLSDNIYQNKIGSIVREISCNAYDSHVDAGKAEVPFDIHLPDALEPWFAVRDYGVGMSKEIIRGVFTKYFSSTKSNSNSTIGAFGLGAKTPFCYTDQFTVTSISEGNKTIWSAYIKENGEPDIIIMHEEETTEGNGVEIKVAVKREDFRTFLNECQNQLKYFKVKPNFNTQIVFREFEFDQFFEGSFGVNFKGVSGITIVQGVVGYPLHRDNLSKHISETSKNILNALNNLNLQLFFDIGQIGVTASREAVEYTPFTCKNIEAKLLEVHAELSKEIIAKYNALQTEWERVIFAANASNFERGMLPAVVKVVFSPLNLLADIVDAPHPSVAGATIKKQEITGTIQLRNNHLRKLQYRSPHSNIHPSEKTLLVFNDCHHNVARRVNILMEGKFGVDMYLISAKRTLAEVKAYFGDAPIIELSSVVIPKKVRVSGNYEAKPTIKFYEYDFRDDEFNEVRDERLQDIEDDFAYFVVDDFRGGVSHPSALHNLNTLRKNVASVGAIELPRVIAVRTSNESKIPEHGVKLEELYDDLLAGVDTARLISRVKYAHTVERVINQAAPILSKTEWLVNLVGQEEVTASIRKLARVYNKRYSAKLSSYNRLRSIFGEKVEVDDSVVESLSDKIKKEAEKCIVIKLLNQSVLNHHRLERDDAIKLLQIK